MTNEAIDTKAFRSMNYGMYIISTKRGDELVGCVVNTFQQVTSSGTLRSHRAFRERLDGAHRTLRVQDER